MKNNIIFSILIAITLLLGSCEDNFEPQMYGKLFTSNFPKTESDYEAYLMTCYVPFSVNWSYNLTGGSWQHGFYVAGDGHICQFDATSDYCAPWEVNNGGSSRRKYSEVNFADFVYFKRSDGGNPPYFEKLRDITRFTEIIGVLEDATVLSDTKKKNFIGEARFLRGMAMYYLMHIYGPVPVILDPSMVGNLEDEQNLERPTLTQMTEWITADMEYAVANMAATAPKGRYTATYARFCLMRHYLNEGSYMNGYYDKTIQMYNELNGSGYGLYTNGGDAAYADQFKQANKFNNEVIMAVSTSETGDGSGTNGNFNPLSWYVVPNNVAKYADAANTIPTPFVHQGGGWSQSYNVAPAYYDTYETGDLRKNVILTSYVQNDAARTNITAADIGVKWSGFIINKYPIEIPNQFQPSDIPLARWADVLLMYAEAVARKANTVPTGEAMQGVNDVRARAGLAPLSGDATASYDGFMDALLAERGHELLYEGCRKIDLIRFNKYRHNCMAIKGNAPTSQYIPIPDYAVQQAETYGKTLTQFFERPGYGQDN
ncbi:MAG TPA: RagB/SusD family nutrient uptake outer membrane protein [Prolixibacteraceae bacterium]|nr:RagB/SusD family nutrient uptake outer membrane protein [Prolixibacteraceae bacterium]